jgi:hypothetical protein
MKNGYINLLHWAWILHTFIVKEWEHEYFQIVGRI